MDKTGFGSAGTCTAATSKHKKVEPCFLMHFHEAWPQNIKLLRHVPANSLFDTRRRFPGTPIELIKAAKTHILRYVCVYTTSAIPVCVMFASFHSVGLKRFVNIFNRFSQRISQS